jgi:hypothetical protein
MEQRALILEKAVKCFPEDAAFQSLLRQSRNVAQLINPDGGHHD